MYYLYLYHKRPINWIYYTTTLLTVINVYSANALDCPPGYSSIYGRCYLVSPTSRSWSDAEADCAATGGKLAAVDGQSLLENVTGLLQAVTSYRTTQFWIGLRRTRTDWRWTSVAAPDNLIQPQGCYSRADSQFPVLVDIDSNYTPPQCRQQCTARSRLYAALVHRTDNSLECRCSDSFSPDYRTVVRCTWPCPSNSTYTCGVDHSSGLPVNSSLVYRLVNVLSTFDGWLQGQPNNNVQDGYVPYQSCLALDLSVSSSRRYGWNDENCAETSYTYGSSQPANYSHMCGYYNVSEPMCRGYTGRFYVANRCFSYHPGSTLSWYAARQFCQQQPGGSGDLLRIDTEELLQVLTGGAGTAGLVSSPTRWWVDGTNEKWMWTNGAELSSTTNWVTGQPVDGDRTCTLASLFGAAWWWSAELPCDSQLPYVCEADYLTTTSTTTTTTTTTRPVPSSSSTPGPPGPLRSTSTASLLSSTSSANATSSEDTSYSTTHITAGVIIAIVFTAVVMAITTVRMLVTCCDKTSREDEVRLAA